MDLDATTGDILTFFSPKCTPSASSLTFCSKLDHGVLSWALISTVTVSTRCDLRFFSLTSGSLARSACRGAFGVKIDIFIQPKSQNKLCGLTANESREFNYGIYFVILNDLDHMTLKFCFLLSRVTPGTPPISDFYPLKYFPMICLSRQKIKKCIFL